MNYISSKVISIFFQALRKLESAEQGVELHM